MSSMPTHTSPSPHHPGAGPRPAHRLRTVVGAAAVVTLVATGATVAIALGGKNRPADLAHTPRSLAVALTADDAIPIADGVSITLAPGWTLTNRGSDWVTLYDADNTARMQVTVKPAGGGDITAVLQADADRVINTPQTELSNVNIVSAPKVKPVQGRNFQQAADINYTADVVSGPDITHLTGVFMELLNTSNRRSAFIDYRSDDMTTGIAGGSGAEEMVNSLL